MLSVNYLNQLEEKHKIEKFDVSVNELSKDGEVFEINLLYSYDIEKKRKQALIPRKSEFQNLGPVFFTEIPKFQWTKWARVKYSDDFVEHRKSERGGCFGLCC